MGTRKKKATHGLDLHAREDDVEHLGERSLGRRLVDEVLAGQVDVVAGAHGRQQHLAVHLDVLRRHHGQQRLDDLELDALIGGRTGKTAADRLDDAVDEPPLRVVRVGRRAADVAVGDQLLQAVQRDHHHPWHL